MGISIHDTAVVSEYAVLGNNVVVGPYSVISPNTVIGDDVRIGAHCILGDFYSCDDKQHGIDIGDRCSLDANVRISGNVTMGSDNVLGSGVQIGGLPMHLKMYQQSNPKVASVIIGNNNFFGENSCVQRGICGSSTFIASNTMCMAGVLVSHDCYIRDNAVLVAGTVLAGHCDIGSHAVISQCTLVQRSIVGDHAFILQGTLRGGVIPYFAALVNNNLQLQHRSVNFIGLKNRSSSETGKNMFTSQDIRNLHSMFLLIFKSGYTMNDVPSLISSRFPGSACAGVVCDFLIKVKILGVKVVGYSDCS